MIFKFCQQVLYDLNSDWFIGVILWLLSMVHPHSFKKALEKFFSFFFSPTLLYSICFCFATMFQKIVNFWFSSFITERLLSSPLFNRMAAKTHHHVSNITDKGMLKSLKWKKEGWGICTFVYENTYAMWNREELVSDIFHFL